MTTFILDASVALAWFVDRPIPPYAIHVREILTGPNRAFVPALWRVEVPNGFAVAEKRGMITASDAMMAIQKFEMLLIQSIETVLEPVSLSRVLASARRFRLTAYDACYLDLAQDMHLPLATLDRQLAEAAKQAGVPLLN